MTSKKRYSTLAVQSEHPMEGPRRAMNEVHDIESRRMDVIRRSGFAPGK